jgi:hypothetical protein
MKKDNVMKQSMKILIILTVILLTLLSGCSKDNSDTPTPMIQTDRQAPYSGQIYLYGELHGVKKILDKEFEIWKAYYENHEMRHLFIEMPYYTAEFMNLWMKAEDDTILMDLYDDLEGTAGHNLDSIDFFKQIKEELPETIFHGTDVGHQYHTTGERYLAYLESVNLKESEAYVLTQEAIDQGKAYYQKQDDIYRENKMVENFVRALGEVENADIMGIYGSAHIGLDAMRANNKVDGMAKQLVAIYGSQVNSEDLSSLAQVVDPISVAEIEVIGKSYEASYFGKQDLTGFKDLVYREVWRLEVAFDDFKSYEKTGDVLPYYNYPMLVEEGQVFVLDYGRTDGSVTRMYFISDGTIWNNVPSTIEIKLD